MFIARREDGSFDLEEMMEFCLNCIDWQAVAALGTWAAVLVALFLPFFQNRCRLAITVQSNMCIFSPGDDSNTIRYIGVVCTNAGNSDIVIKNWCVKVEGSTDTFQLGILGFNSLYRQILYPILPCRIQPLDSLSFGLEKIELRKSLAKSLKEGCIQSDDWLVVCFIDSMGKVYKKQLGFTVQQLIDDK